MSTLHLNNIYKRQGICRSCGVPLQKDEDSGTNLDGSKNHEYRFCFKDDKFIDECITMQQKIEKNIEYCRKYGGTGREGKRIS